MPWQVGATVCMKAILRAALFYLSITFAVAFVMGVLRTVVIAPALGELPAVLIELPFLITLSWWVCGFVLKRWPVPATLPARAGMGTIAFTLLLITEAGLALTLGGLSLTEHLARYATLPVMLGLAGQLAFAVFPVVRG